MMRRAPTIAAALVATMLALAVQGCTPGQRAGGTGAIARGAPPPYESVAAEYNSRVDRLGRIWAPCSVILSFTDEDGRRRREQAEGTLQVVRPDHLALSVRKLGERLFWLGSDQDRYWWFDLLDRRIAVVGRHDTFDAASERLVGLPVHPLDVILLLGITPLDAAGGAVQWSEDGRLLGVTTRTRGGGYRRVWLDPDRYEARKIELFDPAQRPVVISDLDRYQAVFIRGDGRVSPRIAGRIDIFHPDSQSEFRLSLGETEDGARRIRSEAFDFESLVRLLAVDQIVDVDRESARASARR